MVMVEPMFSHRQFYEMVMVEPMFSHRQFYEMVMVDPMFSHRQSVWISKPYVPVVHLTTCAGCAVNPQGPPSQIILHRMKEPGDLPR